MGVVFELPVLCIHVTLQTTSWVHQMILFMGALRVKNLWILKDIASVNRYIIFRLFLPHIFLFLCYIVQIS